MRSKFVMLAGVTRRNRHEVMSEINDAVSAAGGWIVAHRLFSNIATTFQFALAADRFGDWQARIAMSGVSLDDDSKAAIAALQSLTSAADDEIQASLNVTFIHDEPDLRREIPSVPG